MPDTRALLFDVFGTLVDWRTSLLQETAAVAPRAGGRTPDWAAVVDDWRRAYRRRWTGRAPSRYGATLTRCSARRLPRSSSGTASS